MITPSHQELVGPSDVAELAGVSRAAVSNWRKRDLGFPQPVGGTPGKPLFARSEVMDWLRARGQEPAEDRVEFRLWAAINGMPRSQKVWYVDVAFALACARKLTERENEFGASWAKVREQLPAGGVRFLHALAEALGQKDPGWALVDVDIDPEFGSEVSDEEVVVLADIVSQIEPTDLGSALDYVLGRHTTEWLKAGSTMDVLGSRISALLANASLGRAGTIYDAAFGMGVTLLEAVSRNPALSRVFGTGHWDSTRARQRMLLHDIEADLNSDRFAFFDPVPELLADVVVVAPPIGPRPGPVMEGDKRWVYGMPPKSSGDFMWIQHALAHLAPQGRALVVTPMSTLSRGGAEQHIREAMIRAGCIEAVVGLPGKMLPHVSVPLALWVLRRPDDSEGPDDILLIDASGEDAPERGVADWLNSTALDISMPPHARLGATEIVATRADLTPRRWIAGAEASASDLIEDYRQARAAVDGAIDQAAALRNLLESPVGPTDTQVLTVAELEEAGLIEVLKIRSNAAEIDGGSATPVSVKDVRSGRLPDIGQRPAQHVDPDVQTTRAGDVLVSTTNGVYAVLDEQGGHVTGSGVHVLRALEPDRCRPGFLAAVIGGRWNWRFLEGGAIERADVRVLEIPMTGVTTQEAIAHLVTQFGEVVTVAQRLTQAAQDSNAAFLDAIRFQVDLTSSTDE